MDPLLISAASGMRARMESLDMLANNLANATTGGYKSDREFYSAYVAAEADQAAADGVSPEADRQPVVEKRWTDFTQGNMRLTGNTLDIGLDGSGFLAVNGPSGLLYTRSGNLKLSSSGVLTTADGYPVRTVDGNPIQSQSKAPLVIDEDGTVHQDDQTIGQLSVVDFADRNALDKRGLNYFFNSDPQAVTQTASATVRQGNLEESNVGSADAAGRLISVMRQFETLQKAISIGADMNKSAVEEVARVAQ